MSKKTPVKQGFHPPDKEKLFWCYKSKGELRWWFHFLGRNCFHIQISRPKFAMGFGVSTHGEHTVHGDLFGFYWYIECWALAKLINKLRGNEKGWPPVENSFRFYWFEKGLWFSPWGHDMESCHDDPWWRKTYHIDFPDLLLGKMKYSSEVIETFHDVIIPMPERNYLAKLTFVRSTWKRPRGAAVVRDYTDVELDRDAPMFPGKGENSWDQGDDCIWMMSVKGHSLAKGVGGYVTSCLEYREKHGRRGFFANPVSKVE